MVQGYLYQIDDLLHAGCKLHVITELKLTGLRLLCPQKVDGERGTS